MHVRAEEDLAANFFRKLFHFIEKAYIYFKYTNKK